MAVAKQAVCLHHRSLRTNGRHLQAVPPCPCAALLLRRAKPAKPRHLVAVCGLEGSLLLFDFVAVADVALRFVLYLFWQTRYLLFSVQFKLKFKVRKFKSLQFTVYRMKVRGFKNRCPVLSELCFCFHFVIELILARNCLEPITPQDKLSSHSLKERCIKCSRRHRSIVQSTQDKHMVQWFNSLPFTNAAEYRKVMVEHEQKSADNRARGPRRTKFDLLERMGFSKT